MGLASGIRPSSDDAERGWNDFLTDADRQRLSSSSQGKTRRFGLGVRPVLLLVDIYREALGTRDTAEDFEAWPMSCGESGWVATDRTASLLEAARGFGVPVVHTTATSQMPTRWGLPDPMHGSRDYQIVEEVSPIDDELIIRKAAPSAFNGTPLSFHLKAMGIDTVVICGESTSGCVRSTAVDAATLRYKVAVVKDCCFDRIEASHWINLFDIEQKYGDVIQSEEAARYFQGSTESPMTAPGTQ